MITQEQTLYTLAKEYPNCGFTIAVPQGDDFSWSHILWTEGNSTPLPTEQEAENLWNNKWKAEWDAEQVAVAQKVTDKASAKAKLISGEALTEAEADTIVI